MAEDQQEHIKNLTGVDFHFDIRVIWKALQHLWIWAAIVGVVSATACYAWSYERYNPQYTTSTTFAVANKDAGSNVYTNLSTTTQLTSVFSLLLDSDALKQSVAEHMGLSAVPGTISAVSVPKTNLLQLKVTAATPKLTFDTMNAVLAVYPRYSRPVMGNAVMQILEEAKVPQVADGYSGAARHAQLGLVVGIGLAILVIALLACMQKTIHTEEEIPKKLDTELLAVVPHQKAQRQLGKKKAVGLLVNNMTVSFDFVEAQRKLCTRVEAAKRHHHYQVFLVSSAYENEGKTSTVANLGLLLAKKGYRVLIVDADLRKPSIYRIFEKDISPSQEIGAYLRGETTPEQAFIRDDKLGLTMLCGTKSYFGASDMLSGPQAQALFATARQQYDYVLLDTSPMALVADAEEMIEIADACIFVVRQNMAMTEEIRDSIHLLNQGHMAILGCVFNDRYGRKMNLYGDYGYGYGYGYGGYGYGYDGAAAAQEKEKQP